MENIIQSFILGVSSYVRLWETFRQREIICRYVPSEIPELNGNERH